MKKYFLISTFGVILSTISCSCADYSDVFNYTSPLPGETLAETSERLLKDLELYKIQAHIKDTTYDVLSNDNFRIYGSDKPLFLKDPNDPTKIISYDSFQKKKLEKEKREKEKKEYEVIKKTENVSDKDSISKKQEYIMEHIIKTLKENNGVYANNAGIDDPENTKKMKELILSAIKKSEIF